MSLPEGIITTVANEIKALLEADLVGAGKPTKAVEAYRHFDLNMPVKVIVTYLGGMPFGSVSGEQSSYFDFAVMVVVAHENTPATWRSADEALNVLEVRIQQVLLDNRKYNENWFNIELNAPSRRPNAPKEFVNCRYGEVYFRVVLAP